MQKGHWIVLHGDKIWTTPLSPTKQNTFLSKNDAIEDIIATADYPEKSSLKRIRTGEFVLSYRDSAFELKTFRIIRLTEENISQYRNQEIEESRQS